MCGLVVSAEVGGYWSVGDVRDLAMRVEIIDDLQLLHRVCEEQSGTQSETETMSSTDDQTWADGGSDGRVAHRETRDSMQDVELAMNPSTKFGCRRRSGPAPGWDDLSKNT